MAGRITSAGLNIIIALVVLLIGTGYRSAFAIPVAGQQLYYIGGPLQISILPYDASFTSILSLSAAGGSYTIGANSEVGKVVNIANPQSLGIALGDELIFGMFVTDTGNTFFSGSASLSADNFAHFLVDFSKGTTNNSANVAAEDLKGGGDKDFNDAVFQITGGISLEKPIIPQSIILAVPEPASLILLVFGLLGAGWSFQRNKKHS